MAKKTKKKPAKKAAKKKPAKKQIKARRVSGGAKKKAAPKQAAPAQPAKPRHGEFMWNELMTRDDERALNFFEGLLGWTHQDWPMGPDAVYRLDNVDARFEKALSLGGEAIHPPTDIPEVGRFCIIKDPTGAAVALLTPMGGTA
jgi:predicted enzyme related to lactoylglutathione lyase